jgi:uncharacterized protein (TIGR02611 family)
LLFVANERLESREQARSQSEKEAAEAASVLDRVKQRVDGVRAAVVRRPGGLHVWRLLIAVLGTVVIAAGVVMLVTPGPGWLMIFLGIGIWATEFSWAQSVLSYVQRQVRKWTGWLAQQPRWRLVTAGVAALVVIAIVVWLVLTKA